MKREIRNIFNNISIDDVQEAAKRAFRNHGRKSEVVEFNKDFTANCEYIHRSLREKSYMRLLSYCGLEKRNKNNKLRKIKRPSLATRILQHLFLNLIEPIYESKDNLNGLNCKQGAGITASDKKRSVLQRMKHIFYDELSLEYCLVIDQRECYKHVIVKPFRKALKKLITDRQMIDFIVIITFVDGSLPIGTPTSPFVHHILMLSFDYFVKGMTKYTVRYADDNFLAFHTKEEAQAAKWRIKNFWWYELGIRAKRRTVKVQPLSEPLDFCGYKLHRNHRTSHNKGYTTVRKSTVDDARKCDNDRSWAAYFGIMKHADAWALMRKIEKEMKLRELTQRVRIDRKMDAKNIQPKELIGEAITIYDYEIRADTKGTANWIKCLVGIEEKSPTGEPTGRIAAREFHGNYQGIIQYLLLCEQEYGKQSLLPLEEVEIENQCGYIFKESTNQIKYIV